MRKSPLAVLFMVVFIDLVGFGIVLPLLPRYAERYHVSGFEQGLLLASFSAMRAISSRFQASRPPPVLPRMQMRRVPLNTS